MNVGVGKLRQNLSKYLSVVEHGERVVVTSHNKPIAVMTSYRPAENPIERMIEQGVISTPKRRLDECHPVKLTKRVTTASDLIIEERERERGHSL